MIDHSAETRPRAGIAIHGFGLRLTGPNRQAEDAPSAMNGMPQLEVAHIDLARLEGVAHGGDLPGPVLEDHLDYRHRWRHGAAACSSPRRVR